MVQHVKVRIAAKSFEGHTMWVDTLCAWWFPGTQTINMRFRDNWAGLGQWGDVFSEKLSDMGGSMTNLRDFIEERFHVVG